jgi:3-oxoacyl-[acyl-carrier protein] reductase
MLPVMAADEAKTVMAVVTGDAGFGDALVRALDRRSRATAVRFEALDDAAGLVTALDAVADVSALVHVCGDDAALESRPLGSTDPAAWDAGCERVLRRSLASLQAAHAILSRGRGGRIVIVTATAGVSGAARAAPLLAALEGTRSMAKSAARQWGEAGISVNCVAVPLGLLAPSHASCTTFLPPAALPRDDPLDDVAGAVEFLAGPGAAGVSGATLLVDGGAVMAP